MKPIISKLAVLLCSIAVGSTAYGIAPDFFEKLEAETRPADDRARDGARRPYQVLSLLGVEAGMTVLDIGAGGGWYTRVLSAAVGPDGTVISQAGPGALNRDGGDAARAMAAELGNVEVAFEDITGLDSNIADVAVTALNIHHAGDERAAAYFQAIHNVLKPGAVAAVIDHAGSPGISAEAAAHRIEPSVVRGWIEAAGLEIVTESDLLRTAADDHSLDIRHPSLGRNTDRFLFVVRKPS